MLSLGFRDISIDMDNEVVEDDDDINLESFGVELDAPLGFRDKIILFKLRMKKIRMRIMILLSIIFMTNKACVIK